MTPPLKPLSSPQTFGDVLRNIDDIVNWAAQAQSHIGYFAALYKRTTLAIRDAVNDGTFDDGARMERLDIAFATRYFDALNTFHQSPTGGNSTLPWRVAFFGDHDGQAIILQHMMAGMNAHITFDLGLAVFTVAPRSMDRLADDYDRVNTILCKQLPDVLKVLDRLSPELRWTRVLIPGEIQFLERSLTKLRKGAWEFAYHLATNSSSFNERTVHQEAWTAALGSWYLQPPARLTPFPALVRAIAKRECRDVSSNLKALEEVSNTPHKPKTGYR